MKIAVVGTGVVGTVLGACLARKGSEVLLVDSHAPRLGELRRTGLRIRDPRNAILGDVEAVAGRLHASIAEVGRFGAEVVFVCVKAAVLGAVVPELERVRKPQTTFVSFQNGLGTEDLLAERLGKGRVLRVVVNYAGRLVEDGAVEVSFFNKPNYVGGVGGSGIARSHDVAALLTGAGLDTEHSDAIGRQVWEKVILNAAMSPVCALTGLTMREVMESPGLRSLVETLAREGISAAEADGVHYPAGFFDSCMDYLAKAGPHKPSMLADVEAGRRTEIEFLNAKICERARRANAATPTHRAIAALVGALDERSAKR